MSQTGMQQRCWEHDYCAAFSYQRRRTPVTREQCLELNDWAKTIADTLTQQKKEEHT
jgi:hypothetical protein